MDQFNNRRSISKSLTPETIYLVSEMNVALQAAQELHRIQQRRPIQFRQISSPNQIDHEAAFLTIFNCAIQWEPEISPKYRPDIECLDAYRRGRRDGLHGFMAKRFPNLFGGIEGEAKFSGMWEFCVMCAASGDKAKKETIQDGLEEMMGKMNLGLEGIEDMMGAMGLGFSEE
jgi:hypothetical protein